MNNITSFNAERDASAGYWARQFGKNALFSDVSVGESFSFKANGETCVKRGLNTYSEGGKTYRTGRRTGVVRGCSDSPLPIDHCNPAIP